MRCWGCHLINTCPAAAMRAYPLHELSHHSRLSPSVIRGLGCCWRSSLCHDMLMFSLLMLLTHSLWIGGAKRATCVSWQSGSQRSSKDEEVPRWCRSLLKFTLGLLWSLLSLWWSRSHSEIGTYASCCCKLKIGRNGSDRYSSFSPTYNCTRINSWTFKI